MAPFELLQPASLGEALTFLDAADARAFSGGTALMLMMKAGVLRPKRLVSLRRLGMERIQANGSLRIGAMTTLRSLETSDAVRQGWPVIARTLRMLSNVRVRNVATVGGALAHADPHMDLPPLFCALGARVTIEGKEGRRTAPVEELYAGYLETTLKPGELITEVEVPALGKRGTATSNAPRVPPTTGRRWASRSLSGMKTASSSRRRPTVPRGFRARSAGRVEHRKRPARVRRLQETAAPRLSETGDR